MRPDPSDVAFRRNLSRERAKDMAGDYGLSETMERQFAERRGIRFRERVAEWLVAGQQPRSSLKTQKTAEWGQQKQNFFEKNLQSMDGVCSGSFK